MKGMKIAFIGLGAMGLPMTVRLLAAGFTVYGVDISEAAHAKFVLQGGISCATPREAASEVSIPITMLPNGAIVRDVILGKNGAAEALAHGSLVIDMSSSAPMETRQLARDLGEKNLHLIDSPVSGGVKRAIDGSLAIMVGGDADQAARAKSLFEALGKSIFATGPVGSGHAVKALNNYVSAAGLQAACEAALIAEKFGIDPNILVDVLNSATGRNNSTEVKMKPFILSGSFASGFSMALMAKDIRTASDLAADLDLPLAGARDCASLWADASTTLGNAADHTEIYRYLAAGGRS